MNHDVFISYHTATSKDIVEKICAALEGSGIKCWYAPRDCHDSYAGAIVDAISQCKVFLLIINKNSVISEHCLNELGVAYNRFSQKENIAILPYRVEECTLSKDLYYYINRIHIFDGSLPPELQRIRELVNRILVLLDQKPQIESTVSGYDASFKLIGSIVYPDNAFVGRKNELAKIHEILSGGLNKVVLRGMGGIGKSEIAKMYLKEYGDKYEMVVWVDFGGSLEATIADDAALHIRGLSRSDYPDDDVRGYMERKLRVLKEMTDRNTLFVIDNFDVTSDPDMQAFCAGNYSVIFTSRNHQIANNIPHIDILPMCEEEDLFDLFCAEYKRPIEDSKDVIREIFAFLDNHTLSIRLVASAMQSRRIKADKMLELLKEGSDKMQQENQKAADVIFGNLKQVFKITSLDEDELYVLKNLYLVPLSGIEVEYFLDACEIDDFDVIDSLIERSWIVYDIAKDTIHLHPLIKELMGELFHQDATCCDAYINTISNTYKESSKQKVDWMHKQAALSRGIVACISPEHPLADKIYENHSMLVSDIGLYDEVEEYLRKLMNSETIGYKLLGYGKLAHNKILAGFVEEGYGIAKEGLAIAEQYPREFLVKTCMSPYHWVIGRVAEAARTLGEYEVSKKYFAYVLEDNLNAETKDFSNIGWGYYHLVANCFMAGEFEEGETMARECIKAFEACNDRGGYSHAVTLYGYFLARKGRLDEALRLNQESIDILTELRGSEFFGVAKKIDSRGDFYASANRIEDAISCWETAIQRFYELNFPLKAKFTEEKIQALKAGTYVFKVQP